MATFAAWLPGTRRKPASSHVRTSPTHFYLVPRARRSGCPLFLGIIATSASSPRSPVCATTTVHELLAGPSWWHMSHQGSGFDSSWRVAAAAPPRGLPSPSSTASGRRGLRAGAHRQPPQPPTHSACCPASVPHRSAPMLGPDCRSETARAACRKAPAAVSTTPSCPRQRGTSEGRSLGAPTPQSPPSTRRRRSHRCPQS